MGREYQIAFIGTIISMITFIIIGLLVPAIASATSSSTNGLIGIAWASLSQVTLPVIGKLPLLPLETIQLMALTDVTISSSNAFLPLVLSVVGSLPFAIGGVMTGYGFYGFHKQEQSTVSLITALIMMIGFGALAVIVPLGLLPQTTISPWTILIYNSFSIIVPLTQTTLGWGIGISIALMAIIVVVGYILLGTTMIVIREKTPKRELMLAAGILTIIGALLLVALIGIILVFIAYIMLALVFNELRK